MEALRITVPWPPSVNHYWRSIPIKRTACARCGSRVVLSKAGREYREAVREAWLSEEPSDWRGALEGRLHVKVILHPPTRRKLDIDNRMKALLDALQHADVYVDDEQIDHLEIERWEVFPRGAAVVEIEEMQARPGRKNNQ